MSRKRSDSTIRLDYYHHLVKTTILCHQHPVTGLLPATANTNGDAWVRDNVYSVIAVWALSMAYRKRAETDEDRARAYQLERSVVKLMRGLLFCMMRQADKVESFKRMPIKENALHAKYDITNGATCVADHLWGHLQVDATSLYILMLAQMTTSGLQIIFSLDEVSFVQNLVFYIESAYRTPDFGVWERGDKTNQGQPELNASSVGMAKAALEAINEFDLFGSLGGPESVIHVLADERQHCRTIFHSLLPRESSSKEVDSALLTVIGFPAFACNDCDLVEQTREKIENELKGNYGCKRFKRDGYRTVMEDPRRPYYEPSELKNFDNIECEWPVFFCCLLLDGLFHNNKCQVDEYRSLLDKLILQQDDLLVYLPELYYVPRDKVDLEKATPHSQERLPGGKVPHLWGQSLYIVGCLLQEGLIVAGELDPLNRHYYVSPKVELVVQVALVAEDEAMKQELSEYDIPSQTSDELSPIRILLARQLSKAYTSLVVSRRSCAESTRTIEDCWLE
ncbi:phosphorylase b kinase regulatory subunit alpha, skeletal muscle isoform-like [Corticium candelabrum]|uniref:phosphorylase b kinase regulatory subunit alpha, skeletal muscle isoform-like n=1 Tax=Corticium candelabrum TaxID=121492 RepID=UPI002E255836|nr:phosphorylase b kinase regulatory subunit alpha, skeletal muscle isoform-like [Corticium candelabrum]